MDNANDWLEQLNSPEQILSNKQAGKIYVADFGNQKGKYISTIIDSNEEPYDVSLKISPRVEVRITYISEENTIKGVKISKLSIGKIESINLSTLDYDGVINILRIFSSLNLPSIGNKSIVLDETIVKDPAALKSTLETILRDPTGQEILSEVALVSGIITNHDIGNIAKKKEALIEFDSLLHDDEYFQRKKIEWGKIRDEDVWQVFFEQNKWIFGYGLEYIFNGPIKKEKFEQILSGSSILESGKRPDGLMRTIGAINFLNIVEIKTPTTDLLKDRQYRKSRVWAMSDPVCGALAQCNQYIRVSKKSWGETQVLTDSEGNRTGEEVFNFHPKCFLIVGSMEREFLDDGGQVSNPDKLSCFEDIRANTAMPRIITFDELYQRAVNIVEHGSKTLKD